MFDKSCQTCYIEVVRDEFYVAAIDTIDNAKWKKDCSRMMVTQKCGCKGTCKIPQCSCWKAGLLCGPIDCHKKSSAPKCENRPGIGVSDGSALVSEDARRGDDNNRDIQCLVCCDVTRAMVND